MKVNDFPETPAWVIILGFVKETLKSPSENPNRLKKENTKKKKRKKEHFCSMKTFFPFTNVIVFGRKWVRENSSSVFRDKVCRTHDIIFKLIQDFGLSSNEVLTLFVSIIELILEDFKVINLAQSLSRSRRREWMRNKACNFGNTLPQYSSLVLDLTGRKWSLKSLQMRNYIRPFQCGIELFKTNHC